MKLSVIIPSYKDPLLQKTIDSLLENAEGEIEIIAVLDGYQPSIPLKDDPRVTVIHFEKNLGMRAAINTGVQASKGEYIMKSDEHCMFGRGFDRLLLEEIEDNWLVVPRLYRLDVDKWEVMEGRGLDYAKFVYHPPTNRITSQEWMSRTRERKNVLIDENIIFQGSCYLMSRKHWDNAIGKLDDEHYGKFAQESAEIAVKTFVAGGKVMVNKKTWYAHKHRKFGRTYILSEKEKRKGIDYALNHLKDKVAEINRRFGLPFLSCQ